MLIWLPPSEGKTPPSRGRPLDLGTLSFPGLTGARGELLDALVDLCAGDEGDAAEVLGLGPTQHDLVRRDARLPAAPTARADRVYSGVLYEAMALGSLDRVARRRASSRLLVASGLFGLVRPGDRIPAYRLAGGVSLPGIGPVATWWGRRLADAVTAAAGSGLVVDLRSSGYLPFWRPAAEVAARVATVRVLHERDGRRSVVSHLNKATKGRVVRDLLVDGGAPRSVTGLVTQLRDLGWQVELGPGGPAGTRLDVVVSTLDG